MRLQRLFKISSSFILCVILFLPCVVSAGPLDNWHQRNTSPSNALLAVTYGDGNFIAVGLYLVVPFPGDPREEKLPAVDTWVVYPMLKMVHDFEESVKKYPFIPIGTPDPYEPSYR